MFLCKVAKGNVYKTKVGQMKAEDCPPNGFDTVEGEVGQALNYPEVVVYDPDQAVPSYFIVYTLPMTRI
jgi:hypothetical protein